VILALVLAGVLLLIPADQTADAGFTVLLIVDTPTDAAAADGKCSIREAIDAANSNTQVDTCNASLSQPGATDNIIFDIGANPVINVTSPLPVITSSVFINGNTGGATRVELRGPGGPNQANFYGLSIGGDNTTVRNMVINSFPDAGINSAAESFTLKSSYIGVLADGMTAAPNNAYGVRISGGHALIGGTGGTTPGGPCTGDCNVISANMYEGIRTTGSSDDVIQGNFIGLDASGTQALGNASGISIEAPGATVGGTSPSARNVIFADDGWVAVDIGLPGSATVQGNLLGTDSTGSSLPAGISQQGGFGILISGPGSVIGGGLPGAGNVISGFSYAGIQLQGGGDNTQIRANLIGTAIDGVTPIPSGRGIVISGGNNVIGGPGEGNVIANSDFQGIFVNAADGNTIRGNSIHSNGGKGIQLSAGGNMDLPPPVITGLGSVHGTACVGCIIDVYSDGEDGGAFTRARQPQTAPATGRTPGHSPARLSPRRPPTLGATLPSSPRPSRSHHLPRHPRRVQQRPHRPPPRQRPRERPRQPRARHRPAPRPRDRYMAMPIVVVRSIRETSSPPSPRSRVFPLVHATRGLTQTVMAMWTLGMLC
jgi:parallel beta-helix repeat protein